MRGKVDQPVDHYCYSGHSIYISHLVTIQPEHNDHQVLARKQRLRRSACIQWHNIQGSIQYRARLRWRYIRHDQVFGVRGNCYIKNPVVAAGCKYWRDLTCLKIQFFYAYEEGNIASHRWAYINQTPRQVQSRPGNRYGGSDRRRSCIPRAYASGNCWRGGSNFGIWSWCGCLIEINGTARQAKNYQTM